MAKKQHGDIGGGVDPKDAVKVSKQGLSKAIKIFRFVIPYKWTFIVGMAFLLLSNLTTLSFPLLIGEMTKVIEGKSTYKINEVTLFFFAVLIVQAILSFFRIYTFAQVSEKAMRDVRQTLYAKIITLPIFHFEKRRVGELMSRITSDITQLQDVLSITLAEFFRQVFTLVGGVALITYISWKLTLFMLATFPVLVISAIATSGIGMVYYLRFFMTAMAKEENESTVKKLKPSILQTIVLLICAIALLIGGYIAY
mgnify:CR=1 FL=1